MLLRSSYVSATFPRGGVNLRDGKKENIVCLVGQAAKKQFWARTKGSQNRSPSVVSSNGISQTFHFKVRPRASFVLIPYFDQNVWIIVIIVILSLSACDFISAYRMTLERIINFTSHELTKSMDGSETSKYLRIILSYKRDVNYADRHVLPLTRWIDLTNMSKIITVYKCARAVRPKLETQRRTR